MANLIEPGQAGNVKNGGRARVIHPLDGTLGAPAAIFPGVDVPWREGDGVPSFARHRSPVPHERH